MVSTHELVKLSDEDLEEAYKSTIVEGVSKDDELKRVRGTKAFLAWWQSRIWVQNATGQNIVVFVNRQKTWAEIASLAAKVGANLSGATAEIEARFRRVMPSVQCSVISAGSQGMKLYLLGSAAGGGRVSAVWQGHPDKLYCKDVFVEPGWCLKLYGEPFDDAVLVTAIRNAAAGTNSVEEADDA